MRKTIAALTLCALLFSLTAACVGGSEGEALTSVTGAGLRKNTGDGLRSFSVDSSGRGSSAGSGDSAVSGRDTLSGIWQAEQDEDITFEFFSDGRVIAREAYYGWVTNGVYSIDGGTITFTFYNPDNPSETARETLSFSRSGDTIYIDGEKLTRIK